MARNQVVVLNDVSVQPYPQFPGSKLHFQFCRYVIETSVEYGYRFMWSRDGKLLPLRGGARIPSVSVLNALVQRAIAEGWGARTETNP